MNKKQRKKLKNYRNLRDITIESFQQHPEEIEIYLKIALEEYEKDHDAKAFLLSLRTVAEATGGMAKLAKKTKLNRENLYRALSAKGNPRFSTIDAILHALGFGLALKPL
jgi:probable addiction module antidote protein